MTSLVRRVTPDGYVLSNPNEYLLDGYSYQITRGPTPVAMALGLAISKNPLQVVLAPTDSSHPLTGVRVGDLITLIGPGP